MNVVDVFVAFLNLSTLEMIALVFVLITLAVVLAVIKTIAEVLPPEDAMVVMILVTLFLYLLTRRSVGIHDPLHR